MGKTRIPENGSVFEVDQISIPFEARDEVVTVTHRYRCEFGLVRQ